MKTSEITNRKDRLDSRDIIARIEELRGELDNLVSDRQENTDALLEWLGTGGGDLPEDFTGTAEELEEWGWSDDAEELRLLETLAADCEGVADWIYGATLIRDSYFEDYARDLASEIGVVDRGEAWPHNCIDWKKAAQDLQSDYSSVSFDGVDYWIR